MHTRSLYWLGCVNPVHKLSKGLIKSIILVFVPFKSIMVLTECSPLLYLQITPQIGT